MGSVHWALWLHFRQNNIVVVRRNFVNQRTNTRIQSHSQDLQNAMSKKKKYVCICCAHFTGVSHERQAKYCTTTKNTLLRLNNTIKPRFIQHYGNTSWLNLVDNVICKNCYVHIIKRLERKQAVVVDTVPTHLLKLRSNLTLDNMLTTVFSSTNCKGGDEDVFSSNGNSQAASVELGDQNVSQQSGSGKNGNKDLVDSFAASQLIANILRNIDTSKFSIAQSSGTCNDKPSEQSSRS